MLRAGITGGIGSGKSVVCRVFRILGVPVYEADLAARRLMEEDDELKAGISLHFGTDVFLADGKPDRRKLAERVFHDPAALERLNNLVHPAVFRDYINWELKQSGVPYTLREAAILFETGVWKWLDHVILVDASEELRLKRVLQRDKRSENEIRAIMNKQWSSEKKKMLAHSVIINDGSRLVIPQVLAIDAKLREKANGC